VKKGYRREENELKADWLSTGSIRERRSTNNRQKGRERFKEGKLRSKERTDELSYRGLMNQREGSQGLRLTGVEKMAAAMILRLRWNRAQVKGGKRGSRRLYKRVGRR